MWKRGVLLVAVTILSGAASCEKLTWREMASLPQPVAGYMAGVLNGQLLIIGGSYWVNNQKHRIDTVQVFDPATNTWSRATSLPAPRSDAASATLDGDIYCFGGVTGEDAQTDAIVLHHGKWSTVPEARLPQPRLYSVAVVSGEYIYLLGGISKVGDYKTVTNTFWRWRPGTKGWEVLPPLPGPGRSNHAMAEIDGDIYVFGGATTGPVDVENLQDAYKYVPRTRKWSRLSDLTIANRSWWAVGLKHRALLLAGYTHDFASDVYLYEPKQGLQSAGSLPRGLADIKFFHIGDRLVGTGGEVSPGVRAKWTFESDIPKSWLVHVRN
jgi:N-acetylneuraminic acid mutarotase